MSASLPERDPPEDRGLDLLLAALYAPGFEVGPSRDWPRLVRAWRRGEGLAAFPAEAIALEDPFRRDRARRWLDERRLATAAGEALPNLWPAARRAALGRAGEGLAPTFDASPPPAALWTRWISPDSEKLPQSLEETSKRPAAGIGGRTAAPAALAFAREVGALLAGGETPLVSGGAPGCDDAFAVGHGGATVLLPHGLDLPRPDLRGCAVALSPFAPEAPFSRERAMRRNALIVGAAGLTVVASARRGEGGSWHAAVGALRARAALSVYVGPGAGEGAEALAALGALPVASPEEALALVELAAGTPRTEDLGSRWAALRGTADPRAQPPLAL